MKELLELERRRFTLIELLDGIVMTTKATGIKRNSPYRVALFAFWLMLILIIADWIQIVVHECLGHSPVCILNGGTVYGYGIVSLGCGYTIAALGKASPLIHVLFLMNGMGMNCLLGLVTLLWLRRRMRRTPDIGGLFNVFLAMFIIHSITGALGYAFRGFLFGEGDAGGALPYLPASFKDYAWVPFFLAGPAAGYLLMKPYTALQQRLFPIAWPVRRLGLTLVTLGGVFICYQELQATFRLPFLGDEMRTTHREKMKLREAQIVEATERLQREHPTLSKEEVRQQVAKLPAELKAVPTAKDFKPLLNWAQALFLLAAAAAVWRAPQSVTPLFPPIRAANLAIPLVVVASGLAIIFWLGPIFWLPRFGGAPLYEGPLRDEIVSDNWAGVEFDADSNGNLYYIANQKPNLHKIPKEHPGDEEKKVGGDLIRYNVASGTSTVLLSDIYDGQVVKVLGEKVYYTALQPTANLGFSVQQYDLTTGRRTEVCAPRLGEAGVTTVIRRNGAVIECRDRLLNCINSDGSQGRLFSELPLDVPGMIQCATEGPDGSIWAACGIEDREWGGETDVLVKFAPDGAACTIIEKGLSCTRSLSVDSHDRALLVAQGYSTLMLVQPDAQSHVSLVLADRRTQPDFVAPSGVPASGGTETCFYYSIDKTKTLHRVMLPQ